MGVLKTVVSLAVNGGKAGIRRNANEIKMPRKYKRKQGVVPRTVTWTEESMLAAFEEMKKGEKGVNQISRIYGIPSKTLRRRFAKNDKNKLTLGKHPVLGFDNEKRLVAHIFKLGEAGFPPDRTAIRQLAYQFAKKLQLKHNFDEEREMAGYSWFQSFMERNPGICLRQSEGLSIARAQGLNREEVKSFYDLLAKILTEYDLLDKPDRIFNMDESGIQLNNKPGKVVAKKGVRVVKTVTYAEKGETVTIIACCNAIGNFLPPVLILKGVNKKPEFEEGLPPGSKVYMQKKSAYINSDLFYKWLTEHFIPNKPQGKVLLILDGHSSHSSAVNMLEAARDNEVILLCLPSHTTSALQPLDRAVFGPLKTFYNAETNQFIRSNPNKKLTRYNSGKLIANAWIRAAIPANAISGFRGSGIYPINLNALPDSEFSISDMASDNHCQRNVLNEPGQLRGSSECEPETSSVLSVQELAHIPEQQVQSEKVSPSVPSVPESIDVPVQDLEFVDYQEGPPLVQRVQDTHDLQLLYVERDQELALGEGGQNFALIEHRQELNLDGPRLDKNITVNEHTPPRRSPNLLDISQNCLAGLDISIEKYILDGTDPSLSLLMTSHETLDVSKTQKIDLNKETPSKFLEQSSPIPKIPLKMSKRAKQSAEILNSKEKIDKKKLKDKTNIEKNTTENNKKTEKKKEIQRKSESKPGTSNKGNKDKKDKTKGKKKKNRYISSSSETTSEIDDIENVFQKLTRGRGQKRRPLQIYNSDSDTENKATATIKGKATKGIPVKKRKEENKKDSMDNYCVECFENYSSTKSQCDWIACVKCQQWLHENCTRYQNYCTRCGKMKMLVSSKK